MLKNVLLAAAMSFTALTTSAASSQALPRLGAPTQAITASPIRFGGFHHFGGFHGFRRFHGFGPGIIIGAPGFYYGYGGCAWLRHRALVTGSPYWWHRYHLCLG
jgi:hypothetical protein